jgi:translation initiation factor IF-2
MSETEQGDEGRRGSHPRTLSLKRGGVEQSQVRQSFSRGRSKSVVVEKKRKRVVSKSEASEAMPAPRAVAPAISPKVAKKSTTAAQPAAETAPEVKTATAKPSRAGVVLRTLTDEEKVARAKALSEARVIEAEARKRAEEDAARRAKLEEEQRRLSDEAEARKRDEEDRRRLDEETRRRAEEEASRRLESEKQGSPTVLPRAARDMAEVDDEDSPKAKRSRAGAKTAPETRRPSRERRPGKLTITNALDDEERQRSLAAMRRRREREKRAQQMRETPLKISREVVIPDIITVQELASRMAERSVDVVKLLMQQGQMVTINDVIDTDTAQLIAEEMGHTVKRVSEADVEEGLEGEEDETGDLESRAPIVTIMGHVDHGKTSLLDALRESDVVSSEAGGITQHIGAYQVTSPSGQPITFIDTPGHEAFTAMRGRGAQVTDIVVLVVAANDGVMPQTVEAIHHAKAAKVPLIVAVNKIDLPEANPGRVRNELLQHEIVTEALGGDVLEVAVSAKMRTNLAKLEEAILLQAEILDLKANPHRAAQGTVIEAKLDRGRGPVATVLIQRGTLKVGDIFVAGCEMGRVRALVDHHGEHIVSAGPSVPVEILGFNGTPEAGDRFLVVGNETRAREIVDYRQRLRRERVAGGAAATRLTLEQLLVQAKESGSSQELPLIVKADVQGSVEAISGAVKALATEEVQARVIHSAVGGITESDVTLAQASGAPIIAFNVRANAQARDAAQREGVEIRYYSIIYDLVNDVKAAMSGLLSPSLREIMLGNAEILEVFSISKVGKVAGCRVTEGKVRRQAKVRLIRDNVVIHEGELSTLKRFKDDAREVQVGQECGMSFANYHDLKVGDIIECFEVEEVARSL